MLNQRLTHPINLLQNIGASDQRDNVEDDVPNHDNNVAPTLHDFLCLKFKRNNIYHIVREGIANIKEKFHIKPDSQINLDLFFQQNRGRS